MKKKKKRKECLKRDTRLEELKRQKKRG